MIRLLNKEEIDIVSAGEIVIDPSYVIKELVENSIDSGATEIHIHIKDGGKSFIEIMDNGPGISDLKLAITKHATSKFISIDHINTLGFRGEALAAINAVSQMKIVTCFQGETKSLENGEIRTHAGNPGTTITIQNLFFNMPARQKFLKSNEYEGKKIENILINYIVFYEKIKFTLQKNQQHNLFGLNNPMHYIFGSTERKMFQAEKDTMKISGYFIPDSLNKSFIFVNGRPIKNKQIHSVVYKQLELFLGRTCSFVVKIIINPENIDVNIHPTKQEIKFINDDHISLLIKALHLSMKPNTTSNLLVEKNINEPLKNSINEPLKNLEYSQEKENINISIEQNPLMEKKWTNPLMEKKWINPLMEKNPIISSNLVFQNPIWKDFQLNDKDNEKLWQINTLENKYAILIKEKEFILMDIHASHERIILEKIIQREIPLQKLLTPIVLSMENPHIEEKFLDYEYFGGQIIIKAIPKFFTTKDIMTIMTKLGSFEEKVQSFFANHACKNAIKSGDYLNKLEIIELWKQLEILPNGAFCNHGRPTYKKYTISILDKLFDRL